MIAINSCNSVAIAASIALWLFGVAAYGLSVLVNDPSAWWVNLIAVVVAIVATVLGSLWIRSQKERRSTYMICRARDAVEMGVELSLAEAPENSDFIKACAELSGSAKE